MKSRLAIPAVLWDQEIISRILAITAVRELTSIFAYKRARCVLIALIKFVFGKQQFQDILLIVQEFQFNSCISYFQFMAKKSNTPGIDPVRLTAYEDLVTSSVPGMQRKGKSMPYTSVNGNMFSFLDKTGNMSLRLPDGERETFLSDQHSELSVQHGRIMKEYVTVPEHLWDDIGMLGQYFSISHTYTSALKPK